MGVLFKARDRLAGVPYRIIASLTAALLSTFSLLDTAPNFFPFTGLLYGTLVIAAVFAMARADLDAYRLLEMQMRRMVDNCIRTLAEIISGGDDTFENEAWGDYSIAACERSVGYVDNVMSILEHAQR